VKILFISSGNKTFGINPIVRNQGESLSLIDKVEVDYFSIRGKGFFGYLNNIKPLKKRISHEKYDLIHAHYFFSGCVASFAGARPLIVSLMGSDLYAHRIMAFIIQAFSFIFSWRNIIVKSCNMSDLIQFRKTIVIPNGVDLTRFAPMDIEQCRDKIGWEKQKTHILFASDPQREEKNYCLTERALRIIGNQDIEIHFLNNVPNEITPLWYNASDVVLLSSKWEGSPNVIKEAMACNRPIVSTDVGDVNWLLNGCEGCFISPSDKYSYADAIKKALKHKKSEGRSRIIELGLSSDLIAKRIYEVYQSVIN
jgi:teichuronic acid biosynthesis glycosyltransferase TuaC